MELAMNKFQTPLTDELLESLPAEVQEQLLDILANVEFVKRLISPNRPYAKDLPRDDKGRVIVDLVNPHIQENMDYFRPSALYFQKHGVFTHLKPNANPNSEFGKWIREERRRSWEGYVRESDGEWVTGYQYWFLNYSPIMLSKIRKDTKRADRVEDMPDCWEGISWRFHCLDQASNGGKYNDYKGGQHMAELASRSKGKSYSLASILNHIFTIGDNAEANEKVKGIVTAYQKEYLTKDGVINKFIDMSNFCASNTQFPRKRLKSSLQEMTWTMGYKDMNLDIDRGTQNTVIGVSSKDDESKLRGKRAAKILIEEFGCHMAGTPILLLDGTIKSVEDIKEKDVLMGDDCTPRVVQKLYKGRDQLYKITLSNGDYQVVNSVHPVYFEYYDTKEKRNKSMTLTAPELCVLGNDKITKLGYYIKKAKVSFGFKYVPTPYLAGYRVRSNVPLPIDYKINSNAIQLDYVSGFVDSNAIYSDSTTSFEIIKPLQYKKVLTDVKFMCECSGLRCILKIVHKLSLASNSYIPYYKLIIQDPAFLIKTKIHKRSYPYSLYPFPLKYSFTVEPYVEDTYYGFTVDDNHLFLLGDLTIVHNTFPRLTDLYNVILPSVQEGDIVFGQIYMLGCVCSGTKVWTLEGKNINIEDLKKEDGIIGYSKLPVIKDNYVIHNSGITRESIGKVIEPIEKECVEIILSNNTTLKCSIDHPIFTQTKISNGTYYNKEEKGGNLFKESFIRADELNVGDRVCECREINIFGNSTLFDSRLIGMLIGEGSYVKDIKPKYTSKHPELLDYIKRNYNTSISLIHTTKRGYVYEDIIIKGIKTDLKKNGIYGQSSELKRLPTNYQTLTEDSVRELLSGLYDTKGVFHSGGARSYIKLSLSNIDILKEVQLLWRKFGVLCSITKVSSKINSTIEKEKPKFTLIINGAYNLERACKNLLLLVQQKQECSQSIELFFTTYRSKKKLGYDEAYLIRKVVDIKNIGKQFVYNLSACTSRTYLANNIITHNTAGDNDSDFSGAQEIMYNPKGYNMYALPNVYDRYNQGKPNFVFFFPGYVNRKGCYNEDGVSDVIKSLIEILMKRYITKYNSTDPNTILKTIAEVPITPAEAIIKMGVNLFPIVDLTERLGQLDSNTLEYNDVYVGELSFTSSGEIEFVPTSATPIRNFPHKDNKMAGAIEIFQLPEVDKSTSKVYDGRYLLGADPYDDDESNTMSLGSIFVLDLWTDKIVAEYTGRPSYADDYFEICRKLCLFYNGRLNYEYNKKGLFGHFSSRNSTYLLTDVLDFLKDKQMMKEGYGNKAHPYSEKVYTQSGVKTWGSVNVGDLLYDTEGNYTKVVDIPFDAITGIYKITLNDGRIVRASGNHLWNIVNSEGKEKLYTTLQLLRTYSKDGKYNLYIPSNKGVEYPSCFLRIPSFFMGVLLSQGFPDQVEERHGILFYFLSNITSYKFNSKINRLYFLQGVLSNSTKEDSYYEFTTSSEIVCDTVIEIARSLGLSCIKRNGIKDVNKPFIASIYVTDKELSSGDFNPFKTAIIDIQYDGVELAKCVTVDSKNSQYLIGDFISTHNSKGTNASAPINNYALRILRNWLLFPISTNSIVDGEETEIKIPRLYTLRSRALIQELISFNSSGNFDRISAMGMLMLLREDRMILYQNDVGADSIANRNKDYAGNDPFFINNYDKRLKI